MVVELTAVLFGKPLHSLSDVWILREDILLFIRVGFHIEERQPDFRLRIFAGVSIITGILQRAIGVRQVEFPSPVAADNAFERLVCREGVVFVRILRSILVDDQILDIQTVNWVLWQLRACKFRYRGQKVDGAHRTV